VSEAAAQGPDLRVGRLLAILVVASGLGPLAMNIVLPSLPGMVGEFGAGYGYVQLVLTLYLVSLAAAQLAYGSLSDGYGRRPVMIAGLLIFLTGSLICALAWNLPVLLAGRIIQGAGGSVGIVLGRAILRDLFGRDQAASLLGYVTMSMVLAPLLGPAIGGLFEETLGWRAGQAALAVFAALTLAATWAQMPETNRERGIAAGLGPLLRAFGFLARIPVFLLYTGILAFTAATFYAFLGGAPYIVIELMGRSPGEFGLWAMSIAGGYMIGNFVTGRYAVRVGTRRMIRIGVLVGVAGGFAMMAAVALGLDHPFWLFATIMVISFSNGLVIASAVTSAVSIRTDLAGAGAGLSGFVQIGFGALVTVIVGIIQGDSAMPMATVITLAAIAAAVCYLLAARHPDPADLSAANPSG
jgi:DHA1 family bicyclomycin/chloramphenicol resistance-like MFS transporter